MDNELDELTRHRMNMTAKEIFNNEFWLFLLMVLVIFMIGFVAGNISHDKMFHVIEQLQNSR